MYRNSMSGAPREEEEEEGSGLAKAIGVVAGLAFAAWGISSLVSGSSTGDEEKDKNKIKTPGRELDEKIILEGNWRANSMLKQAKPWCPPPSEWVKVNIDGSVRGADATIGGLIRDSRGNWIIGFIGNLGSCSITFAELSALRQGLQLAWDCRFPKVIVESDSEAAIKLITEVDPNSHHLRVIIKEIQSLKEKPWSCTIQFIYREGNKCADALAAEGHKSNQRLTILHDPPESEKIKRLLQEDRS